MVSFGGYAFLNVDYNQLFAFRTSLMSIADVGAVMSHAVIVSRELGIPAVVSVTDATRRIPDGALIEVDGTNGRVTVLVE